MEAGLSAPQELNMDQRGKPKCFSGAPSTGEPRPAAVMPVQIVTCAHIGIRCAQMPVD